jgi:hypothetical protein
MEWQPTAIFAGEALFAYLNRPLLLAEIYVPFVWRTDARKVLLGSQPATASIRGDECDQELHVGAHRDRVRSLRWKA